LRPASLLVLSGPNLDKLGRRQVEIYGTTTLEAIHARLAVVAAARGARLEARQSAHEGTLVDWIGSARDEGFDGLLLNAGAYTHTSIALLDALLACGLPAVEVHLSHPEAREAFRHVSRIAPACIGKVCGFGARSYELALLGLLEHLAAVAVVPRRTRLQRAR
jgi:3-dehydroquinate dehydratase II